MPAVRTGASRSHCRDEINMLPMIDILLVLLIMFMIRPKALRQDVHLPPPTPSSPTPASTVQLVLEVTENGYLVNAQPVPDTALEGFLRAAFRHREVKLLFIRARPDVPYRDVIEAVDRARGAGIRLIAYMPGP